MNSNFKNIFFLTAFLLCIASQAISQKLEFTENCQSAYDAFMSMKINEGKSFLTKELKENSTNFLPLILVNYEDFITLTFNENPTIYKSKKSLLKKRLEILEKADKNSPYFLFSKALLHFQWSIIQTKYSDYWDASWDFRKSYLLFNENKKKFPQFLANDIFIGSQEAIVSTIPSGYKWISSILGMKGNMKNGLQKITNYINLKNKPFWNEAIFYRIYLKNYLENDAAGALNMIKSYKLDTKNNLLFVFMASNLALNNKDANTAEQVIQNRNASNAYMPFPMLNYELADAKMRKLDFSAISYFEKYIETSKSKFYIKDACMSIALCYYLQGNNSLATKYKSKIKSVGDLESDADKQAQRFGISGKFPDKGILKARLLYDGGYNEKALEILMSKDTLKLRDTELLEYNYRLARVYDELAQEEKALYYYFKTIEGGKNSTEYFAARAALQAGNIYEKKGNLKEAMRLYKMILNMDDHEFKNSLDQRAKASINRLNGG